MNVEIIKKKLALINKMLSEAKKGSVSKLSKVEFILLKNKVTYVVKEKRNKHVLVVRSSLSKVMSLPIPVPCLVERVEEGKCEITIS